MLAVVDCVICRSIVNEYVATAGVAKSGCTPAGEIFEPAGSGAPGTILIFETGTFFSTNYRIKRRALRQPVANGIVQRVINAEAGANHDLV